MATSVFELSYRKLVGSFRSSQGHLLPKHIKEQLVEYAVRGTIPPDPLKALLTNDFSRAFRTAENPLEAARLHTIWEFIYTCLPTDMWRHLNRVHSYSASVKIRPDIQRRYDEAVRQRLMKDSRSPLQID
jgi:hypothetical protein